MMQALIKFAVTAALIVLVSELAKRSTLLGALVASLPLVSLIAIVWLYLDTGDVARVAAFSREILILVIPSLALFAALPVLLERGLSFAVSLLLGCVLAALAYLVLLWFRQRLGWQF